MCCFATRFSRSFVFLPVCVKLLTRRVFFGFIETKRNETEQIVAAGGGRLSGSCSKGREGEDGGDAVRRDRGASDSDSNSSTRTHVSSRNGRSPPEKRPFGFPPRRRSLCRRFPQSPKTKRLTMERRLTQKWTTDSRSPKRLLSSALRHWKYPHWAKRENE